MIPFKSTINRAEQMLQFEILQMANKIIFFSPFAVLEIRPK